MAKKRLREQADDSLMESISRLQQKLALTKTLQATSMDDSPENVIALKILKAKYNFLFKEARLRQTSSAGPNNVISR